MNLGGSPLKVMYLVLAVGAGLLSVRYFSFAYQGLIDQHIPAHKRRAFDIDEAIGPEAVSEGWKMLAIAVGILIAGVVLAYLAYRADDDI